MAVSIHVHVDRQLVGRERGRERLEGKKERLLTFVATGAAGGAAMPPIPARICDVSGSSWSIDGSEPQLAFSPRLQRS